MRGRRAQVLVALGVPMALAAVLGGCGTSNKTVTPSTTTSTAAASHHDVTTTATPTTQSQTTTTAGGNLAQPPPNAIAITTSADVFLKSGPGSSFANVVAAPNGATVEVTCYVSNGQPDTDPGGSTSTFWFDTYYSGQVGWVSNNYLNAKPAAAAPQC